MSDDKQAKAKHLDDANFSEVLAKAKEDKLPLFVDFFAEWCGPCKMAAPIVDKLSGEYKGKAIVAKLNVDEARETAGKFNVMSIPTVVIFKDGEEFDRKIGFPGEEGYKKMIEEALSE
ncbi:MAG: thioredoxin [Patescibacteria group bacterium]